MDKRWRGGFIATATMGEGFTNNNNNNHNDNNSTITCVHTSLTFILRRN